MELGAQADDPRELGRDLLALGREALFLFAEQALMGGVAVLDPAHEARGELAGTIALAGRLDVGILDLGEEAFGLGAVGRQLGPLRAQRGACLGERAFALGKAVLLLIDVRRHGPRLLPRRYNPQSLSAEGAVKVDYC